jgi:hypothetical protein
MQPKITPRCSWQLATPYPEPDQSNPRPPSYLFRNHINVALLTTPSYTNWYFSFRISTKIKTLHAILSPPLRATRPARPPIDHANDIWCTVEMNPEDGGSDLRRSVDNYLPFYTVMTAKSSVILSTIVIDGRKMWEFKFLVETTVNLAENSSSYYGCSNTIVWM